MVCGAGQLREAVCGVRAARGLFWAAPWLLEARLQTAGAGLLRGLMLPPASYRTTRLTLSDGGTLGLARLAGWSGDRGTLLVLPGLAGGPHADYVRMLAAAARALRLRCVVLLYRGAPGLPLTSPRLYGALSHTDLQAAVTALRAESSGPLLACGVSLGGLVLGQYLAREGPAAGVQGALALSPPLDVPAAARQLRGGLGALLSMHMARGLRPTLRRLADAGWPDEGCAGDPTAALRASSLRDLDAAFTAPHFGFAHVDDYYAEASLHDKLSRVSAPLLCVCAADDPLQPLSTLPLREVERSSRVALLVTPRGGHLGFLEGLVPPRRPEGHFVARVAHQYFSALLDTPDLLHWPPATPISSPAPHSSSSRSHKAASSTSARAARSSIPPAAPGPPSRRTRPASSANNSARL